MGLRKCCVSGCRSAANRAEDRGVTFHKFPVNEAIRNKWTAMTRILLDKDKSKWSFVCSRHFRKADFEIFKGTKFVLVKGAIPTIFPWGITMVKDIEKQMFKLHPSEQSKNDTASTSEVVFTHKNIFDNDGKKVSSCPEEMSKYIVQDTITKGSIPPQNIPAESKHTMTETKNLPTLRIKEDDNKETTSENFGLMEDKLDNVTLSKEIQEMIGIEKVKKTSDENGGDMKIEIKSEQNSEKLEVVEEDSTTTQIENISESIFDTKPSVGIEGQVASEETTVALQTRAILDETKLDAALNKAMRERQRRLKNKNRKTSRSLARLGKKKGGRSTVVSKIKNDINADKIQSTPLSVGSRIDAKDFDEIWHPACIMEVDYDEEEVLVHYDDSTLRHDEWISVKSPRLRPHLEPDLAAGAEPKPREAVEVKAQIPSNTYCVGERCLARWAGNARYMATVRAVLPDGKYEIMYDDGFIRVCKWSNLSKLKEQQANLEQNYPSAVSNLGQSSPVYDASNSQISQIPTLPLIPFHKHLFDPSLDYLGSKKERREMKRKLNVKELFSSPKRLKAPIEPKAIVKTSLTAKKKPPKTLATGVPKASTVEENLKAIFAEQSKIDDLDKNKKNKRSKKGSRTKKEITIPYPIEPEATASTSKMIDIVSEAEKPVDDLIGIADGPEEIPVEVDELLVEAAVVSPIGSITDEQIKVEDVAIVEKEKNLKHEDMIPLESFLPTIEEIPDPVQEIPATVEDIQPKVEDIPSIPPKPESIVEPKLELRPEETIEDAIASGALNPGDWCCRWLNGEPEGVVSQLEKGKKEKEFTMTRKSVQVTDERLPPGWSKHMVRRSLGSSAGKWDVVLVNPEGRRFRTRLEMQTFLSASGDPSLQSSYGATLLDFGVHRKLSRRLGWDATRPGRPTASAPAPRHSLAQPSPFSPIISSPLGRKQSLSLKRKRGEGESRRSKKMTKTEELQTSLSSGWNTEMQIMPVPAVIEEPVTLKVETPHQQLPLDDGFVYVGSIKVQVIDNLLRCPKESCFKNFRKSNLLQMHIKHYHSDLSQFLGDTPNVAELASARTYRDPVEESMPKVKAESDKSHRPRHSRVKPEKIIESQINLEMDMNILNPGQEQEINDTIAELFINTESVTPTKSDNVIKYDSLIDSPKLRNALESETPIAKKVATQTTLDFDFQDAFIESLNKPKTDTRDETLKLEDMDIITTEEDMKLIYDDEPRITFPQIDAHNFGDKVFKKEKKERRERKKGGDNKKGRSDGLAHAGPKKKKNISKPQKPKFRGAKKSEELRHWQQFAKKSEETLPTVETQEINMGVESNVNGSVPPVDVVNTNPSVIITETGEKIKIVQMKREEIINCHCGYGEEDGLMIQCELCLCWQHGLCHAIEKESQVPERYVCYICLNPRRGRKSQRWLQEQSWLYEGTPGCWAAPPAPPERAQAARKSHELTGNLLLLADALHALRVKMHVASKKDHPKLYLWAKSWEKPSVASHEEPAAIVMPAFDDQLMESQPGKENCPIQVKPDQFADREHEVASYSQSTSDHNYAEMGVGDPVRAEQQLLGLAHLLASPGALQLQLALPADVSTTDLERLAKTVQDSDTPIVSAPEPEEAIEPGKCRVRLLQHVERALATIDARLDSIEAHVAELESQDPSLEDDETADYFPRTKQTIQMLLRDLSTMEELALIT